MTDSTQGLLVERSQGFQIFWGEDGFFWQEGGYFDTLDECRVDIANWNGWMSWMNPMTGRRFSTYPLLPSAEPGAGRKHSYD